MGLVGTVVEVVASPPTPAVLDSTGVGGWGATSGFVASSSMQLTTRRTERDGLDNSRSNVQWDNDPRVVVVVVVVAAVCSRTSDSNLLLLRYIQPVNQWEIAVSAQIRVNI